jgi:hypothetical protein
VWAFCYAKEKNVPEEKVGKFGYGEWQSRLFLSARGARRKRFNEDMHAAGEAVSVSTEDVRPFIIQVYLGGSMVKQITASHLDRATHRESPGSVSAPDTTY